MHIKILRIQCIPSIEIPGKCFEIFVIRDWRKFSMATHNFLTTFHIEAYVLRFIKYPRECDGMTAEINILHSRTGKEIH